MRGSGAIVKFHPDVERGRLRSGSHATRTGDDFGAFTLRGPCGIDLFVIASPGDANVEIPWEHVSVSTRTRCPNWPEMCFIKSLFWDDEETVVQFHPPKSQYINQHPYCLHLWKPLMQDIPLPPRIAIGIA